jgi:hypothetical protein
MAPDGEAKGTSVSGSGSKRAINRTRCRNAALLGILLAIVFAMTVCLGYQEQYRATAWLRVHSLP